MLVTSAAGLGEDVWTHLRLWLEPGEAPQSALARTLFATPPAAPVHVKWTLEHALLEAGIAFVFGCYPVDVLRDTQGRLAGLIVANRSGRQAIRAKAVIDATARALVARTAGALISPYPKGLHRFQRIVLGGTTRTDAGCTPEPLGVLDYAGKSYPAHRYTLEIEMADDSPRAFMHAERVARDRTWQDGQVLASERIYELAPDTVRCRARIASAWPGAGAVMLDAFRPEHLDNLIIASPLAGLSAEAKAAAARVTEALELGTRLGMLAAHLADVEAAPLRHAPRTHSAHGLGELRDAPLAPGMAARLRHGCVAVRASVPSLLDSCDVLVAGGGTSGAPAAIAAAREGCRTLVVEHTHGLGGVGTLGTIVRHWYGNVCGFCEEVDGTVGTYGGRRFLGWEIEPKMEWLRTALHHAGGAAWFHSIIYGVAVKRHRVTGVLAATPYGHGIVALKELVDATGSADAAIAAGAPYEALAHGLFTIQGTGLTDRNPDTAYNNSDWCVADDTDPVDCTRLLVAAHKKYRDRFDSSPIVGTRERRRIHGAYTLQPMDILLHRQFRDSICHARSNFDAHSYYVHPIFRYWFSGKGDVFWCYVPYRCLLPHAVEHVLVTGLALSAQRDVLPIVRMQPDLQNQGYAAGLAAALCVQRGVAPRRLPVRLLQARLVEKGIIYGNVVHHTDTPPPSPECVRHAALRLDRPHDLALLFAADPDVARTALEASVTRCSQPDLRLLTAQLLACFGVRAVADELRAHIAAQGLDEGLPFPRMHMASHVSGYSPMDAALVSLADTGHPAAVASVTEWITRLTPQQRYSHFWAAAYAAQRLADARLAAPLAACLRMPGVAQQQVLTQHAMLARTPDASDPGAKVDNTLFERSARELILAAALYSCGDAEELGRATLQTYTHDLRGVFAGYAARLLRHSPAPVCRNARSAPA